MIEVKVPSPGESITEVQLASWLVENNTYVNKDDEIAEIDSDKATLSITAPESGLLIHKKEEGTSLIVDEILCHIDTSAAPPDEEKATSSPEEAGPDTKIEEALQATHVQKETSESKENDAHIAQGKSSTNDSLQKTETRGKEEKHLRVSPLAKKQMQEQGISKEQILKKYGSFRIGRDEISAISNDSPEAMQQKKKISRDTEHKKMSPLRIKLAERLVAVKNQTAMLTTFNEVNMSPVMEIRKEYKEEFKEKHNISLGLMSFFTKAVAVSLELFPQINARLEDEHIVYHNYIDIGIAVSAPKGLMVPVIRNAGALSMADIEHEVRNLALKARDNKLSLEEMSGGTFTITNGGVFGSMLSTPIINPPQSAILGMHNIVDRPIAVNGKVEIHPVMYVALSYDHRIIDGKESVSFLRSVKEFLENPLSLLLEGRDPYRQLLDL